ncbi:MAG: ankyrin repeat domain-containing protein, partial [Gammaproteobacteria bacterium]
EFGFEDNRNQHEREMLVEWLRYLRYEDYSGQETVKVIYDALKALSDEVESQPLLHWAAQSGLYELTKWLLANQLEDVNITNKQGYTALHMATKCANEALVLLLLQSGANRSAQTIYNKTPAMMASSDNPNKQAILTRIKGYLQRQSPLPDPNNISQSDRKHNSLPPLSVSRTTHVSSGGIFAAGRQLSTYQPSNAILEKQNEFKTELGF